MKIFSNFVLFCGGVNVRFLRENCPNERHKFYPIGLGVIVTASLAFISMMFATNSIFGANSISDELVLILFSLFWAFAIFTIDWGLIKTMKKSNNLDPTFGDRIRTGIPVIFRLIVAIIISFSISRPMEVKIYEKRLKAQIENDRQDFVTRKLKEKEEDIKIKNREINNLNKEGSDYLAKKNESPRTETFKINLASKNNCEVEYKLLDATNKKKIADKEQEKINIRNNSDAYGINDTSGVKFMRQWAKDKIHHINNTDIPKLKKEVAAKKIECDGYAGKVVSEQEKYQSDYDAKLAANTDQVNKSIANRDSNQVDNTKAIEKITRASYASFDTLQPGLITQLESMSNFEKTPEGKSAGWVRIILLLVIICIDTAPIVIKLLTKRGVYEEMQEADEGRLEYLSRHESYANKHLIQELSKAQREVLTEAIKQWKDGQKERTDLSDIYIDSNNHNNP